MANQSQYRDQILTLHNQGVGPTEISRRLGCNISLVYYHTNASTRRRSIDRLIQLKRDNKTKALELKGGKCAKCGYDRCRDALVFHHRDPAKKDIRISGTPHSWKRLESELDKVVLLCCRCHTELHGGVWSQSELDHLGLVYVPSGHNTGRRVLPPSKRRR